MGKQMRSGFSYWLAPQGGPDPFQESEWVNQAEHHYVVLEAPIPCTPSTIQVWLNGLARAHHKLITSYIRNGHPVFVFEKEGE